MAAKRKRKKRRELAKTEMDMTPMIDVTFLLLIFFLCLEFKTLESKLSANLPKDVGVNTTEAEPMEKIDVRVVNDVLGEKVPADPRYPQARYKLLGHKCHWWINDRAVKTRKGLLEALGDAFKLKVLNPKTNRNEARPITIKTGPGVTYMDVTQLIDAAKFIGFQVITFGGGEGTTQRPKAK